MDKKTINIVMDKARSLLDAGWHCSEGILIAVGERYFDLSLEMIRLSTPFAGGVGGTHDALCGALTGGLMVIGGAMGRSDHSVEDQDCQDTAAAYKKAFQAHFGQVLCYELREKWVGQPGQLNCVELVRQAAGVLINVLNEAGVKSLDEK